MAVVAAVVISFVVVVAVAAAIATSFCVSAAVYNNQRAVAVITTMANCSLILNSVCNRCLLQKRANLENLR